MRSTKKILYRIEDPALRFWFRVYSPHRSRWSTYPTSLKKKLIHDHAASVFEDFCRARYPGARRFWEGDVELDLVAPDPEDRNRLLAAEIKFRRLSVAARRGVLDNIEAKWAKCSLRTRHAAVRFEVLDAGILGA